MLIRLVRMGFKAEKVADFLTIFELSKDKIRASPGCQFLELMRDKDDESVFMTYSIWENEKALEMYRHSALFEATWAETKVLFKQKPVAYSVESVLRVL